MICSCQGGFDGQPHFMVNPSDLSSYSALPAVVLLAKQIIIVMNKPLHHHATWFDISAAGHTVIITKAEDPEQFPCIWLGLDEEHSVLGAFIGRPHNPEEGIRATPDGITETDDLRSTPECEQTYELLKEALGWR